MSFVDFRCGWALSILSVCLLLIANGTNALGQSTNTWTGGNNAGDWSSNPNWISNGISQAPADPTGSNPGEALVFAGANTTNLNNISGLQVNSITFNSGASAFTLVGNSVAIGGLSTFTPAPGITNNSIATESIGNSLVVVSSQTWDAAAGNLVISSAVTASTSTYNSSSSATITMEGAGGTISVGGPISDGGGVALALKVSGGTTTLSGSNSYSGGTTISGATLRSSNATGLGSATGSVVINNGGTLDIEDTNQTAGPVSLDVGTIQSTGGTATLTTSGVTVDGTGNIIASPVNVVGAITQDADSGLTVNGTAGTDSLTNGSTTLNGTGTLGVVTLDGGGNGISSSGVLTAGGLTVNGTGNTLSSGTVATDATVNAGGVLVVNGTLQGTATLTGGELDGSGTVTSTTSVDGGTINGSGLTLNGTTFTAGSGDLVEGTETDNVGVNLLANSLVVQTGTLTVTGTGLTIGSGAQLDLGGKIAGNVTIDSAGVLQGDGTGSAVTGSTTVTGGTVAGSGVNTLALTGPVTFNGGNNILAGQVLAGGGVDITNAANVSQTGTLSGNVNDTSSGTSTFSGVIADNGGTPSSVTMNNASGTLTLAGVNTYTGSTTVGSGELDLSGTLGSGGGTAITSSATFNETNTGSITGTSSLVVAAGTTTLNGNNTYSGATMVHLGGTMTIRSDDGLSTNSATTVQTGGSLQLENNIATTAASLTLNGNGTGSNGALENVSGTNTYTGTITLGSNTTIGSDSGTLTLSNTITGSGSNLTLAGAGTGSISGPVATSTGDLTMNGTGTWTLAGVNTYTGNTTINSGVVNLTGTLGSGVGGGTAITSSAVFNELSGGSITGTSSLAVSGGTTTLDAANNYTGGNSVSGGLLKTEIAGALGAATGSITIGGGTVDLDGTQQSVALTTLSGNSTITNSSGTAATLTNTGVTVSGANNTIGSNVIVQGGQVTVTNGASLNNAGTIVQTGVFENLGTTSGTGTIQFGASLVGMSNVARYSLTSTTGASGSLQTVIGPQYVNNNGTGTLATNLSLDPTQTSGLTLNKGLLVTEGGTITSGSLTFVQKSFASGQIFQLQTVGGNTYLVSVLNPNSFNFTPANSPYLETLFKAANNGNQQAVNALNKYGTGAENSNANQIANAIGSIGGIYGLHISNVQLRLTDAREGKNGFSATNTPKGLAGPSGDEGKSGDDFFSPSVDNRWGVFLTGIGDFAKTDSNADYVGYNTTQSGFTLGADYRLTDHLILGVLTGFGHEHAGFADGSALYVDGAKLGFYGTAFDGGAYVNFAGIGGFDTFNSNRVDLGGNIAYGNGTAEEVAGFVGTGYDFTFGNFKIGPTSSLQYERSFTQGWSESQGTVPLQFPAQSTGQFTTKLGMKESYAFRAFGIQWTPELRTEWEHDFRGVTPIDFAVPRGDIVQDYSPSIGLDSLSVVAGSSAQLSETYTVYLYYNGDLLRQGYTEQDVSGGVRASF